MKLYYTIVLSIVTTPLSLSKKKRVGRVDVFVNGVQVHAYLLHIQSSVGHPSCSRCGEDNME